MVVLICGCFFFTGTHEKKYSRKAVENFIETLNTGADLWGGGGGGGVGGLGVWGLITIANSEGGARRRKNVIFGHNFPKLTINAFFGLFFQNFAPKHGLFSALGELEKSIWST